MQKILTNKYVVLFFCLIKNFCLIRVGPLEKTLIDFIKLLGQTYLYFSALLLLVDRKDMWSVTPLQHFEGSVIAYVWHKPV